MIPPEFTGTSNVLNHHGENESLIRTLVDNSPSLVMIHVKGKILFKNQSMEQFLCHPGGEFISQDGTRLSVKTGCKTMRSVLVYLAGNEVSRKEGIELHLKSLNGPDRYFLFRNSFSPYKGNMATMSVLVDITERKNMESYVLTKILETEDRDRKKFAADLHDDLGPLLSSIRIHLGLEENLTDPLKNIENIGICKDLLREAIDKIRIISNHIMPAIIDEFGLDAAIKSFIETLKIDKELSIHFNPALNGQRFEKDTELHFYRIISELINNSIKHSGATKANLQLRYTNNCLSLLYADNGKGYDVQEILKNSTGMGISNLYYRVSIIGGKLDFLKKSGKTYVRIRKNFS